ncbi:unnamed protein product, partial [Discosporangium mesarthrocarpum]
GKLPGDLDKLLRTLRRIRYLELNGNPWGEPPAGIIEKGMGDVRHYFEDLYREGSSVINRSLKVVLVGRDGAGKTSLRQSIIARRPNPTKGLQESTVHLEIEEHDLDGVHIRMFDCAGQV